MPKSTRKRSNSPRTKTARKSKTPSPGKGATKKIEVYYLAKAYKTLKGSPLARFVKNVKKTARQSRTK